MAAQPRIMFATGRKRRQDIWTHFCYKDVEKKPECVVEKDGEKCGHKITGKNTTNLKRHLKAFHNEIEVSQDIIVTFVYVLESSCQMPTDETG